jgi:hypothetical protein
MPPQYFKAKLTYDPLHFISTIDLNANGYFIDSSYAAWSCGDMAGCSITVGDFLSSHPMKVMKAGTNTSDKKNR